MINKNIPRIMGERVFLSLLRTDDEAVCKYLTWMSNETTCVNIEMNGVVVDESKMPGWVSDHSVMRMGIVVKESDSLVGYCHIDHRALADAAWLSINIGAEEARGKGIGFEVMSMLTRYCFDELGVESVHLDVLETNKAAIACYTKVGFKISGTYRKHCIYKGKRYDWHHMDMIREEWEAKNNGQSTNS